MKKQTVTYSLTIGLVLCSCVAGMALLRSFAAAPVFAQDKTFTVEELSQFNGKNGQPAYYAYEGVVYDVSDSSLWKNGQHYGLQAGLDLTGELSGAPHGVEVFKGIPVVGSLQTTNSAATTAQQAVPIESIDSVRQYPRMVDRSSDTFTQVVQISWLVSMVMFFLTFATAPITPWATYIRVPWRGEAVGPDQGDQVNERQPISVLHRTFFWLTLTVGTIHTCLMILSMLGITL